MSVEQNEEGPRLGVWNSDPDPSVGKRRREEAVSAIK